MADEPIQDDPPNVIPFKTKQALYTPTLPEKCWRGVFSMFRETYSRCTEACNEFLFSGCLTAISVVLGRSVRVDTSFRVFPNTFTVNVGPSGKSRKTTAQDFAEEVILAIDPEFVILPGIGSPEGLLSVMQDHPKILVAVNELKIILAKGAQEATRGLIPRLVELYDCKPHVSLPNRKNPITVIDPCLILSTSTTQEWLHSMDPADVHGGLANRFLYFTGPDKAPLHLPPSRDQHKFNRLVLELQTLRQKHCFTLPKAIPFSDRASARYKPWYDAYRSSESDSEILDIVGQRLHTHAMKLMLIYAVMDGSDVIEPEHVDAGCAFADQQRKVHKVVFEGFDDTAMAKIDRSILVALRQFGDMKTWELRRKRPKIDSELLVRRLKALKEVEEVALCAATGKWKVRPSAD